MRDQRTIHRGSPFILHIESGGVVGYRVDEFSVAEGEVKKAQGFVGAGEDAAAEVGDGFLDVG